MKGLIIPLVLALFVAIVIADTVYLGGIIRDQAPNTMRSYSDGSSCGTANKTMGFWGTDFQLDTSAYRNDERGLVGPECNATSKYKNCGVLGSDSTPSYIYTGRSSWGNVQSNQSFYRWFHNSDQTVNVNFNIPLTKDTNANTYSYDNQNFFPIDNAGWGDFAHMCTTDKKGKTTCVDHNFAFCLEAHTRFGYASKDMVFTFSGDDDVWVYINNYLVIDLGALHPSETKSVTLGDLPFLTLGENYRLDFFYCERHTEYSHMQITTSLEFFCASEDWCGVCEGTGQSCCTGDKLALCDDHDACTLDACGVSTAPPAGCTHTPINCTAPDNCHTATCTKTGGCVISAINCADSDPCTVDTCTATGCLHTPMTCNDGKKCTDDTCSNGVCVFTSKNCNDNDACTDDSCTESSGACSHTTKTCNDNNKCTKDTCASASGCVFTLNCDDGNLCTNDKCVSNTTGCSNTPVDCSTSLKCINSVCSPTSGKCVTSPVVCPAKDACNLPACNNATGCQYQAPDCDDHDPCTTDTCDPVKGCQHTSVTCNDNSLCTTDVCVSAKGGCIFTPVTIDDNNKCTADACTATGGVTHTNISASCNDNNDCTDDSCSPTAGCQYVSKDCDDGDGCTTDTCAKVGGCKNTPIPGCTACAAGTCTTTDKCFPVSCSPTGTGCVNTTVNCNDNNNCTRDSCSNGKCSNTDIVCSPRNPCETAACDATNGGACKYTPITCDDFDPCTTDQCIVGSGKCSNTKVAGFCSPCGASACQYTDPCNPLVCDVKTLTCKAAPVTCDDGNACTTDKCNANGNTTSCSYTAVTCPDSGDVCNPNVCNTTSGCALSPVLCHDTDPCTVDSCANVGGVAVCQFPEKSCNVSNPCKPFVCDTNGNCVESDVKCDDKNPCTVDSCVVQGSQAVCLFTPKDCGSDTCGAKVCNASSPTGQCISAQFATVCNDGNPCTDDAPTCNGTAVNCNFTTNDICDDHNACTLEFCDSSNATAPCQRSNVTCYPSSICEVVIGCDVNVGCLFGPVECDSTHDVCKKSSCDPRSGCIVEPVVCTVSDSGCFKGVCDSTKTNGTSPCVTQKLDNWGSRESNNHVLCALRYDSTVKHAAIGAGAAAGIAIGAAAAFGAVGYGGKKGYDYWKSIQDQRFNGVQNNPLYEEQQGHQDNPLYRHSVTA